MTINTKCVTVTGVDAEFMIGDAPSQITLLSGRLSFSSGMVVSGEDSAWKYTIPDYSTCTVDADGVLYGSGNVSMAPSTGSTTTAKWSDGTTLNLTAASDAQTITVVRSSNNFTLTGVEKVAYGDITYEPLADKDFQLLIYDGVVTGFVGTATVPAATALGIGLSNASNVVTVQCAEERKISCYYSKNNFRGYPSLSGLSANDVITVTTSGQQLKIDSIHQATLDNTKFTYDSASKTYTLYSNSGLSDIPAESKVKLDGYNYTFPIEESASLKHLAGGILQWASGTLDAPSGSTIKIGDVSAGGAEMAVYAVGAQGFHLQGVSTQANNISCYLPAGGSLTRSDGLTVTASNSINYDFFDDTFLLSKDDSITIGDFTYTAGETVSFTETNTGNGLTTNHVEVGAGTDKMGKVTLNYDETNGGEKATIKNNSTSDQDLVVFGNVYSLAYTIPAGETVELAARANGGFSNESAENKDNYPTFELLSGSLSVKSGSYQGIYVGDLAICGIGSSQGIDLAVAQDGPATVEGTFDIGGLRFEDAELSISAGDTPTFTLRSGTVTNKADSSKNITLKSNSVTLGASAALTWDGTTATLTTGDFTGLDVKSVIDDSAGAGIKFTPTDAVYDVDLTATTPALTLTSGRLQVDIPKAGDAFTYAAAASGKGVSANVTATYTAQVVNADITFTYGENSHSFTSNKAIGGDSNTVTIGTVTNETLAAKGSEGDTREITVGSGTVTYQNVGETAIDNFITDSDGNAVVPIGANSTVTITSSDAGMEPIVAWNDYLYIVSGSAEIKFKGAADATNTKRNTPSLMNGKVTLDAGEFIKIGNTNVLVEGPAVINMVEGVAEVTQTGDGTKIYTAVYDNGSLDYITSSSILPLDDSASFSITTTNPTAGSVILTAGKAKTDGASRLHFGTAGQKASIGGTSLGSVTVDMTSEPVVIQTDNANDNSYNLKDSSGTTIANIQPASTVHYTIGETSTEDVPSLESGSATVNASGYIYVNDVKYSANFNGVTLTKGESGVEVDSGQYDNIPITIGDCTYTAATTGTKFTVKSDGSISLTEKTLEVNDVTINATADFTATADGSVAVGDFTITPESSGACTVTVADSATTLNVTAGAVAVTGPADEGTLTISGTWNDGATDQNFTQVVMKTNAQVNFTSGTPVTAAAGENTTLSHEGTTLTANGSYTITVNSGGSIGTVTADKTAAAAGDAVTLTVQVNSSSHEFGSLTVTGTSSNTTVETTKVNDTTYTFTMPGENVEVEATWTRLLGSLTVTTAALSTPEEGQLTLTVSPVNTMAPGVRYYYRVADSEPTAPTAGAAFTTTDWTKIDDPTASTNLTGVTDNSYIEVVQVLSQNVDGSGTIQAWGVTQTTTDDGYVAPTVLVSVEQPANITGIANGTALNSIELPGTVTISTSKGTMEADVVWNTTGVSYDPNTETEQTFTVPGTVTLPDGVTNTGNVSLAVSVSVTVAAKGTVTVTGISVRTEPAKTAYTEGDALNLSGLVVTLTYSDSSTEDVALADFAAKGVTPHPVNGTTLSTSETTVTVHAGNYSASFAITVDASAQQIPVTLTLTPSKTSLTGGGAVILTLTGLPAGGMTAVSCDKPVTITPVSATSWSVTLPNATAAYVFTANFPGDAVYDSATASCTVNVTYKSSGGGGGGGSYTPPSTPSTESVTVPISGDDNTIHVGASVTGDKVVIDEVDLSHLDTVIGEDVQTGTVTIDFSALETSKPITTVELPADMVKQIAEAVNDPANDAESLEIILSDGTSIEFDAAALGEKAAQANGLDITISIKHSGDVSLTTAQKNALGNRPGYDISVTSGVKHISDMGGKITVHAPYELRPGEKPHGIVVWYVDDHGNRERCETSYDPVKKRVNWRTDHLSLYMIDHDEALANNPFTDVSEDAYYFNAVLWAVDKSITNGTSDTTFSPDDSCTRAQMATFLWRAAGSPDPVGSTNPFTDVSADAYYAKAVQWAVEQGITVGTSATTFSPDADCTRAQMATFLWRNAGSPASAGSTNPFMDVPADLYYTKAVQWAYEQEITGGTSATTFSPNNICTRAQMVTFLYRCFGK